MIGGDMWSFGPSESTSVTNNYSQQSSSESNSNWLPSFAKENAITEEYKLHERLRAARPALTIPPHENHQNNSTIKKKLPQTYAKDSLMDLATVILHQDSVINNINDNNTNTMQEAQQSQPSTQNATSYYHSPPDDEYAQASKQNIPQQPMSQHKHARSLSKEFSKAYGQTRGQLTPAVIHIPRRPKFDSVASVFSRQDAPAPVSSATSRNNQPDSDLSIMTVHKRLQNTEDQPISPRKHSGHKMPPLGYKDRSKVLESTKNVPTSVGINAINRPQSANVENPAPEDMSDETSIASDNDEEESSEVDEQSPSSDTWLKNWKYDDPEICCICLDTGTDDNNAFVYCDNPQCEVIVHQECYAITVAPGPDDVWLCDRCQAQKDDPSEVVACAICPNKYGAFRRLDKTHKLPGWIHVVCGTWMPKVHIADQTNITGFDIREIPEKNWKSKCYLCPDQVSASFGACVQCDAGGCKKTFHVSCAQKFSLLEDEEEDQNMADPYFTYCIEHSSYNQGQARLNTWEKWVRQRDRYLMSKNEAAAERRCTKLWKKAQKLNRSNSDAISELIRTGFGFRELISDRYATFANEMANAISAAQSNVFQLESENHQMESTIAKLGASLKDTEQRVKRAEKRKADLKEELSAASTESSSRHSNTRRTAQSAQPVMSAATNSRRMSGPKIDDPSSASSSKAAEKKIPKSELSHGVQQTHIEADENDNDLEKSSSPVAKKQDEEKIFTAAKNAIRNGKRLMERAQSISIMGARKTSVGAISDTLEKSPEQASSMAENDALTAATPRNTQQSPLTSHSTKAVDQHPLMARKSASFILSVPEETVAQPPPSSSTSSAIQVTEDPVPQYFRLSPFGPEKELKRPVESIRWLSKLDSNDDLGLTDSEKEIVTEYIPVVNNDESLVSDTAPNKERAATHIDAANQLQNESTKSSRTVQAKQPVALPLRTHKRKLKLESVELSLPKRGRSMKAMGAQRLIKDEPDDDEIPTMRRSNRTASATTTSSSPKPRDTDESPTMRRSTRMASVTSTSSPPKFRESRDQTRKESKKIAATNATASQHSNGSTQLKNVSTPISSQGKAHDNKHPVCATCRQKDIPQSVIDGLGISNEEMKRLEKIRPFAKPGHTGVGKDWDPNCLIPCETCDRYYHSGCVEPPLKNYPARGVSFRCAQCDVVKGFNVIPTYSRAELKNQPKQLRERHAINYHE